MTRQKVKVAFIQNEVARKATFKKRKIGLLKKAHELATLCDVPVGIIVDSRLESDPPEIFPSKEGMNKIIYDFNKMSLTDQTKKMVNQESYLKQRINKTTDSWKKVHRENKEVMMKEIMFNCLSGKTRVSNVEKSHIGDLQGVIDHYLKDVNSRIEILNRNDESSSSLTVYDPAPVDDDVATTSPAMYVVEMSSSSAAFYDMIHGQIENNLKKSQSHKDLDLDLNQKQW